MTAEQPLVVTFGEMLLRLSPVNHPRLFQSDQMRAGFGGAEANVAVALSHLGVGCEYITRLPNNLIGDAALHVLRAEGVRIGGVMRGPERMGIYFIEPGADLDTARVVYDRAASAFATITPEMVDWSRALADAGWFHATGITAALGAGPLQTLEGAIEVARGHGTRISLDLNYRPALWLNRDPLPTIESLVRDVELLIGNPHSVRAMLRIDVADDCLATREGAGDLARRLADRFGCRRVALTRREVLSSRSHGWSATLYDATSGDISCSRRWEVGVLDRIGGGDAFAASLIASLLRGRGDADALEFAVGASALKLGIPGDFNRVTEAEVDKFLSGIDVAKAGAESVSS